MLFSLGIDTDRRKIKGYKCTPWTIPTYGTKELNTHGKSGRERERRDDWNEFHASNRIAVEHSFALLQNRFPILFNIPGTDLETVWQLVCSLLVLHNLLQILEGGKGFPLPAEVDGWELMEEPQKTTVQKAFVDDLMRIDPVLEAKRAAILSARRAQAILEGPITKKDAQTMGRAFRELLLNETHAQ